MIEQIKSNLDNPNQLEKLYRENKTAFKKEFNTLYPDIKENTTAQIWNERLNFESDEISWGTKNELVFVIIASLHCRFYCKASAVFWFYRGILLSKKFCIYSFSIVGSILCVETKCTQ